MRKQELHPRTAVINKTQKNKSKHARLTALQWLAAKFPNAFDNSISICPLKKGIIDDIMQHAEEAAKDGISRSKLREAVVLFTRRIDYLTSLKAKEMRIDLEGQAVESVSEDEAERAALKIKKRVEKSARNARKMMNARQSTSSGHSQSPSAYNSPQREHFQRAYTPPPDREGEDVFPVYPARSAYNNYAAEPQTKPKSPAIMVKHKSAKPVDPDAVARLKAKLGLSTKKVEKTESE